MLNVSIAAAAEAANEAGNINLAEAGLVALQGMLVVFSVLVILMIVLYIMKLFSKAEPKSTEAPVAAAPAISAPAQPVTSDEAIAVICSSVAAMSGDDPTKRLRVVSIQEQSTGKYVWKK